MAKKIFVVESENNDPFKMITNMLTYMELLNDASAGDKGCNYRSYDSITDAFTSEYTHECTDNLLSYSPNDYKCILKSGIPIENIKNHIISNIKTDTDYETEISDAIYYTLDELETELNSEDGIERFNKNYEVKKNELGDSFLIFK